MSTPPIENGPRDPRVDPQPGDRFDTPSRVITVTRRDGSAVIFEEHWQGESYTRERHMPIAAWRIAAKDWKIGKYRGGVA